MIRRFSYLFAGAAFALYAAAGAAAFADPAAPAKGRSETIVRSTTDGVSHEVRIERDATGRTTITRDGKTTVVDAQQLAANARIMALQAPDRGARTAEHLRNALQLRPGQEAALQAYVKAVQPEKRVMVFRSDERDAAKTTPERLADMEKVLAEHDAQMRAYIAATRAFYDQLDPAQKRAFDEFHPGGDHMQMIEHVRMVMPRMPAMPPMPVAPIPPLPPAPSL